MRTAQDYLDNGYTVETDEVQENEDGAIIGYSPDCYGCVTTRDSRRVKGIR